PAVAGYFFFNGNTVFDNPQNFHVAGTVFKYRRPSVVLSDGLEYIIAQGPTLQGLNVMVTAPTPQQQGGPTLQTAVGRPTPPSPPHPNRQHRTGVREDSKPPSTRSYVVGWSACSRTCGEGVQYRIVRCWKMLSPGFDSSVYDSLCLSHDLHKPANRKVCHGQSCGPQWEVSEWSECSGECGEGRMVRSVTCRSSGGLVMSDGQCDQPLRPLAIYPCGDRDCAPHWVEQEWQQCNATCGRGVRQRQVVCAGLEGGVFKEFPDSSCNQTNKPQMSSSCFQRPCSKWFTTSWSQVCSKTCGRGVQVREVKCYQGEELVTRGHSCDSALKPETKQSCEIQSCPTEAPGIKTPRADDAAVRR
uniref:ADAMTS-like protein 2 n=1 Tax=Pundamilia nyererei TaxID=303518 RepID=A0A3B4GWJ3_9CICH